MQGWVEIGRARQWKIEQGSGRESKAEEDRARREERAR